MTPPKTIGKLVVSPLIKRTDSSSSNASSLIDDTVRPLALTAAAATSIKQQTFHDGADQRKIRKYFINLTSR